MRRAITTFIRLINVDEIHGKSHHRPGIISSQIPPSHAATGAGEDGPKLTQAVVQGAQQAVGKSMHFELRNASGKACSPEDAVEVDRGLDAVPPQAFLTPGTSGLLCRSSPPLSSRPSTSPPPLLACSFLPPCHPLVTTFVLSAVSAFTRGRHLPCPALPSFPLHLSFSPIQSSVLPSLCHPSVAPIVSELLLFSQILAVCPGVLHAFICLSAQVKIPLRPPPKMERGGLPVF